MCFGIRMIINNIISAPRDGKTNETEWNHNNTSYIIARILCLSRDILFYRCSSVRSSFAVRVRNIFVTILSARVNDEISSIECMDLFSVRYSPFQCLIIFAYVILD